ncbi:MAG: hypothetical protein WC312_00990 [Candidatus Omnitrophota bacterium]|jgi:hypothetical protein
MEKKKPKSNPQDDSVDMTKVLLERLIVISENSMIVNLALKGIPHQQIRKMAQCDMRRITRLLKPVNKYIKKFVAENGTIIDKEK